VKRVISLVLICTLLLGLVYVVAAGGTAGDPLLSLKYVNEIFFPALVEEGNLRIDQYRQGLVQKVENRLQSSNPQQGLLDGSVFYESAHLDVRVKKNDSFNLSQGSSMMVYAGQTQVYHSGTVVNATTGTTVASGGSLTPFHRYIVAENTTAEFRVVSDTAVLASEGFYSLTYSAETDYNALADALRLLNLFRGSDRGFGKGYELERVPTRIEGLVMFLRLIGEEQQALAFTGGERFADVADWSIGYVSYAYHMGYTKGVGVNGAGQRLFNPNETISASEYMTFLLRALGYSDSAGEFSWDTSVPFAGGCGLLTAGEQSMLQNQTFYRAQVTYLSYFFLNSTLKGSTQTLANKLISSQVFSSTLLMQVQGGLTVTRK